MLAACEVCDFPKRVYQCPQCSQYFLGFQVLGTFSGPPFEVLPYEKAPLNRIGCMQSLHDAAHNLLPELTARLGENGFPNPVLRLPQRARSASALGFKTAGQTGYLHLSLNSLEDEKADLLPIAQVSLVFQGSKSPEVRVVDVVLPSRMPAEGAVGFGESPRTASPPHLGARAESDGLLTLSLKDVDARAAPGLDEAAASSLLRFVRGTETFRLSRRPKTWFIHSVKAALPRPSFLHGFLLSVSFDHDLPPDAKLAETDLQAHLLGNLNLEFSGDPPTVVLHASDFARKDVPAVGAGLARERSRAEQVNRKQTRGSEPPVFTTAGPSTRHGRLRVLLACLAFVLLVFTLERSAKLSRTTPAPVRPPDALSAAIKVDRTENMAAKESDPEARRKCAVCREIVLQYVVEWEIRQSINLGTETKVQFHVMPDGTVDRVLLAPAEIGAKLDKVSFLPAGSAVTAFACPQAPRHSKTFGGYVVTIAADRRFPAGMRTVDCPMACPSP
jgi:hypothetical protein